MLALITGGARSGKSGFAEQYAARLGTTGIYIATSQIYDEEMRERINRHRQRREEGGFPWRTMEEPLALSDLLAELEGSRSGGKDGGRGLRDAEPNDADVILVDCLTLWLSNTLLQAEKEHNGNPGGLEAGARQAEQEINRLAETLRNCRGHILLVTNEVGGGIVPEYPLGRLYRDLAGWMNQAVAAVCDQVFLVTAGIPLELKSLAFRLPENAGKADKGAGE